MNLNIDLSNIEKRSEFKKEYSNGSYSSPSTKSFNLALNLEEVSQIEKQKEIVSSFILEDEYIDRIVAAIGAGLATEAVINARIIESANALVQEAGRAMMKTVVRGGKLTKKKICPEGFEVGKNGMCTRMTPKDVIAYKKRAKKAARSRMRHHKPVAATMKMRNRSLLVRGRNAGKVNRIVPAPAATQVN